MTDDVKEEICDIIKDDMNVQTEANVYEPFGLFCKTSLSETIVL